MRILHLAYRNTSGVPGRWAAAHRAAGHEADLLVELEHPFSYGEPETVMRWSPVGPAAIAEWLDRADVVMAYDHPLYLGTAIATCKPVLFRALGQSSREYAPEIKRLLEAPNVMRATAGTPDLALLLDFPLAGAPFPLPEPAEPRGERVLVHAPSNRAAKGTERILRAAEAAGWTVDLIEDASNDHVLERKRTCDLVVDTCGPGTVPDGYGVNSVESMALGLPVMASASATARKMLQESGCPIHFVHDERGLREALHLLRDPDLRQLGVAGRAFVRTWHSPERRATEDLVALEVLAAA